MKKRGFTLVEIIICISLIALIGTGSFFGVKLINDKIKISKLEQITDKAIEAAQVYLETNKEASNELYSNTNGVSIPLQLLVNEGLLNIDNTDLKFSDLKDEYVVTFLGGSGSSENCEQITSSASWANDKPLYLCMKSDGSSNLATIDPTKYGNLTSVTTEPYYVKGEYPDNYVKLISGGAEITHARIYKIDRDDSISIFSQNGLPNEIKNTTYVKYDYKENKWQEVVGKSHQCKTSTICLEVSSVTADVYKWNVRFIDGTEKVIGGTSSISIPGTYMYGSTYSATYDTYIYTLQPCWKITGGTGSSLHQFELTNKC